MIIAIDGPAATGKSTTAKLVAKELGFIYLDTGAMYRCVTLVVLQNKIDIKNQHQMDELIDSIDINFDQHDGKDFVFLNGKDVTGEIRAHEVTEFVSPVSAISEVRTAMVLLQRKIADKRNCVMEGRDIGTVVFPDAEFKFFLVTNDKVRAERRQKDLQKMGEEKSINELVEMIRKRDEYDSSRKISPLRKAKDAVEIDTTELTIDGQVSKIIEIVNNNQNEGIEKPSN